MCTGTPLTSPVTGIVVGRNTIPGVFGQTGEHTSGGGTDVEVDVYTTLPQYGDRVVAMAHLERLSVEPGDGVRAGDLLGYSGGNPNLDPHSSGPHLGIFSYRPRSWDSLWSVRPNPQELYAAIQAGGGVYPGQQGLKDILRGQQTGTNAPSASAGCDQFNSVDPRYWWCQFQHSAYGPWFTHPLRIAKLLIGVSLLVGAFLMFILVRVGPEATEVAGAVTGQPELVATGSAARTIRSGRPRQAGIRLGGLARRTAQRRERARQTQAASAEDQNTVYADGRPVGRMQGNQFIPNANQSGEAAP